MNCLIKGLINLGMEIQEIWVELAKVIRPQVKLNPSRTSMIYIPNLFVIPGGRFKVLLITFYIRYYFA